MHQFDKVEQFCITTPDKSWDMQKEMCALSEQFYQSLGLAYRVVNIVSGELNNAAAKKVCARQGDAVESVSTNITHPF